MKITGVHPYADKFPMLPDSELRELSESIRENGLRQPVVVTPDGLILDGRNRSKACELANVEPAITVYEGDDLAEYVIDCNTSRRHMSTGARAMATALVLAADDRRGEGRWKRGAVAITESGNSDSQWSQRLTEAGIVLDYKPDLAELVAFGSMALDAAYQQAKHIKDSAEREKIMARERAKREREEAAAEAERNAQIVADLTQADATYYLDQINAGHMKPVSAWAAYQAEHKKELDRLAAERRNDEQQVRAIHQNLDRLTVFEHEAQREWFLAAFKKYPEAAPEHLRGITNPERVRQLAGALLTFAKEMEKNL